MWSQIVTALLVFIVATYVIQLFLPRSQAPRGARRNYARWDIAPLLGFIGGLLLMLSFAEALRGTVIEAWALGLGLGLIISIAFAITLINSNDVPVRKNSSALLATIQFVQRYGITAILALIGAYLAVRIVGAALEVSLASALGVWLIVMAVALFARSRPQTDSR